MKKEKTSENSAIFHREDALPEEVGRGAFLFCQPLCFILWGSALATTLFFFGCSARKARPTQLRVHPLDWAADHPGFIFSNALQTEYGAACQSCHAVDYTGGNSGISCVGCHNQRRDSITNVLTVCTGCHGGTLGDSTGAPPRSLAGSAADTARGVGGHRAMVNGGTLYAGTDCRTCHLKPDFVLAAGHFTPSGAGGDDRAEVALSGIAGLFTGQFGIPAFNSSNRTCSNVYCHGAFPGGENRTVDFYGGPPEADCGTCHSAVAGDDFSRLSGKHFKHDSLGIPCITCHFSTVDSFNLIQPAGRLANHVNGAFDVFFDPAVDTLGIGLFDGVSCSGLPDSPGCHANRRDW